MRVYISKIGGEHIARRQAAVAFLENMGLEPVGREAYEDCKHQESRNLLGEHEEVSGRCQPANGNGVCDDQELRCLRDIDLLLTCRGLYLFEGWRSSRVARIEKGIADELGLDVWFESEVMQGLNHVRKIEDAIHEVTGMRLEVYAAKGRTREALFARLIFVHHANKMLLKHADIARCIGRDRGMVYHYLRQYDEEMKYNLRFRALGTRVEAELNN